MRAVKIFNSKTLGDKIQEERKRLGDSLDAFAQKINITRQTLSRWEQGKGVGPSVTDLLRMCELFHCDFGYIVGEYTCRTKVATDISAKTGLSENAIINLIELNSQDENVRNAIFNGLDVLLDWELLPLLAIRFTQYVSGEFGDNNLYITDNSGRFIDFSPNDASFLLLQNAISDFLAFAKNPDKLSRLARRKWVGRLTEAERVELAADFEDELRRGK